MKASLTTLQKQYWDTRSLPERRGILIAAAFILPLFAYFLLWQPAHDANATLRQKLPALRIQLRQMQKASLQIAALHHSPQLTAMDAQTVKTTVENTALQHHVTLTTIFPQEPNGVRLTIASISFENWINWLRELQQSQHIRIKTIAITPLAVSGMVAIRATLTNGGNE
jgi:type II secretory pathway component PulM